ncbi:hypothetical protein [Alkalibacillus almallahensis]|uniref:hypothetical protein n=1 Tax=Alkalibacillus almallahensis TaxID=1379154 RepID=UPI00141F0388|nr:hypothetical protein [Alkalibacillus almallahensis]NIK11586.1 hypothetical protein [Alkalibacillus almallahensis]
MTKQNKRMILVGIAVLLLAAGAFYYYVIFDLQQTNQELSDDLDFEERRQTALSDSLENQEAEEDVNVDTLRDQLPESLNENGVIRLLNDASGATNTTIETINFVQDDQVSSNEWFSDVSSEEMIDVLSMELSGTSGSHQLFQQFINRIEQDARLAQLNNVQLQQNEGDYTFQVTMTVFAYPLKED